MGRRLLKTCDICRKETERVVAKLHWIPADGKKSLTHSNYTAHADVGECCAQKLKMLISFQDRMTAKEYREIRKAG